MAGTSAPMSGQARRFTAAALIVVVVVLSVWLLGRPEPRPTVHVVVAAEDWPAGREPGEFVTMEMPEASAALFVTADQLADRVPAVAVTAGTVVSGTMLTDSVVPAASDLSAALLAVAVDPSLWPDPGPRAGDAAVLAAQPGGCATAVLPVVVAGEGTMVVEARPQLAAVLGPTVWWIWESPPAGWPGCPAPQPAPRPDEGRSEDADGLN
ncbi:MAG: hypothetical protein F4134_02990 [Acidimicrobiaceae bacterium]|nr:hypothetical protein [Acidimicrobiaceae bacterium]